MRVGLTSPFSTDIVLLGCCLGCMPRSEYTVSYNIFVVILPRISHPFANCRLPRVIVKHGGQSYCIQEGLQFGLRHNIGLKGLAFACAT